jgi:hypothetical protein
VLEQVDDLVAKNRNAIATMSNIGWIRQDYLIHATRAGPALPARRGWLR